MQTERPDIFEQLREDLGLPYISDLSADSHIAAACLQASRYPVDAYPLSEWKDVAQYLLGYTPKTDAIDTIRKSLRFCGQKEQINE